MPGFAADLLRAARRLRRERGYAAVCVLTLAAGVAVTSTVFSLVEAVLVRPLPYAHPERIVSLSVTLGNAGATSLSIPEFFDLRERATTLEAVAAVLPIDGNLTGVDEPERIVARAVSGGFFDVMGVSPLFGRTFRAEDEHPGITEIGVISYGLWQRRFGGDRGVIGRTIRLDEDSYTIVGVMPAGFEHPGDLPATPVEFWYPGGFKGTPFPPPVRGARGGVEVLARVRPGVSAQRLRDDLTRLACTMREEHPDDYPAAADWSIVAHLLRDDLSGRARTPLLLLLGAVVLVLVVACSNVAGLQLARTVARRTELAVRQAIGASPLALVRELLAENLVLAAAAGVAAVALTMAGVSACRALAPEGLPRAHLIAVNPAVLGFTAAAALGAALLFGLAPALALRDPALSDALRQDGRGSTTGPRGTRLRAALLVGQCALAVVLLAGAGLLARSTAALQRVDPGFRTTGLLTLQLAVSYPNQPERGRYVPRAARVRYFEEVLRRVRAIPGVEAAAAAATLPVGPRLFNAPVEAEGVPAASQSERPRTKWVPVSPDYFRTLGVRLERGRAFAAQDDAAAPPVVVVSRLLAERLWPGEDPLGKRLRLMPAPAAAPWATVVGVAADVRSDGLDAPPGPMLYLPYLQRSPIMLALFVRTRQRPDEVAQLVRREVRAVDPDQPIYAVRTLADILSAGVATRRFVAAALTAFAAVALALAAVGLYGLVSYGVSQRRREIALRIALGAHPRAVQWWVVRSGLRLATLGIALGSAAAVLLSPAIAGLLYGVSRWDPPTLIATPTVLLAAALLACLAPSRRAARVDPAVTLQGR